MRPGRGSTLIPPAAAAAASRRDRELHEGLKVPWLMAGALSVLGLRINIPISEENLSAASIAVTTAWVFYVLRRGPLDTAGIATWAALVAIGIVSSLHNTTVSLGSLLSFACAMLPLVATVNRNPRAAAVAASFGLGLLAAAGLGALMAILQALLQVRGGIIWDPISSLPPSFVVSGYNTNYSLQYSSYTFGLIEKPNGVIYPEPSLLSLYSALSLTVLAYQFGLQSRKSKILASVLSLALLLSISTSGVLVLFSVLVVAVMFRRDRWAIVLRVSFIIGILVLLGALDPIFAKLNEGFSAQSSTGLRLVVPYQLLPPYVSEGVWIGNGPGAAATFAEAQHLPGLQTPTLLKLALDYGILALLLLIVAIARRVRAAPRSLAPLLAAVLVAWLVPGEALLNPTLSTLGLFVGGQLSRGASEVGNAPDAMASRADG